MRRPVPSGELAAAAHHLHRTMPREQIERLGQTFMALSERKAELREEFGLDEEDLNLNLGPLGNLL